MLVKQILALLTEAMHINRYTKTASGPLQPILLEPANPQTDFHNCRVYWIESSRTILDQHMWNQVSLNSINLPTVNTEVALKDLIHDLVKKAKEDSNKTRRTTAPIEPVKGFQPSKPAQPYHPAENFEPIEPIESINPVEPFRAKKVRQAENLESTLPFSPAGNFEPIEPFEPAKKFEQKAFKLLEPSESVEALALAGYVSDTQSEKVVKPSVIHSCLRQV